MLRAGVISAPLWVFRIWDTAALLHQKLQDTCRNIVAGMPSDMEASVSENAALPVPEQALYRQLAFTFATIALAVRLTKCDGSLTRDEFLAFRELFPLEDEESRKIRRLFKMAWEDETDAAYYASQVVALYPGKKNLHSELLAHLSAVALADGPLTPKELKLLSSIGFALGFTRMQMSRIMSVHAALKASDPHYIMGLNRKATPEQVRAQYHALMRRYHPDLITSSVHYPEALAVAQRRSASIIKAYQQLSH